MKRMTLTLPLMKRFPKEVGDPSGKVVVDIEFLANREAIRNHVAAYGHVLDDETFDEYMMLFTDDVIVQTSAPGMGNMEFYGAGMFREFIEGRLKGKRAISQRRHTLSMIHIFDQTDTTAKARAQARLGGTNNDGKFISGNVNASYNFWLVKQNGHWKINKMYIESDGGVGESPLPEGAKYEPDARMAKTE